MGTFENLLSANSCLEKLRLLITDFRKGNVIFYILCNLFNSLCSLFWAISLFPVYPIPSKQENTEVSLHELPLGGFPLEKLLGNFWSSIFHPHVGFCWLLEFSLCSLQQQENSWLSWIQFGLSTQINFYTQCLEQH